MSRRRASSFASCWIADTDDGNPADDDTNTHTRFVVQPLPLRVDRLRRGRSGEENLDVVPATSECERHEGRRRADAVAGVTEQLVRDKGHVTLAGMASVRRVTVIAHELRGFRPAGGMGTATTFLALALARLGHSVEILLGKHDPRSVEPHWADVYREAGIVQRACTS